MTDLPWEDNLLERKVESDLKDLLKTLVAFANSVKPGHIATILIGELDDGTAQGVTNPDQIQKKIRETCDKIYPTILRRSQVYENDGKTCVRIEIEYDGETPHFGDAAWVRRGSETIKATDEVFQRLIDYRMSKVRELAKWLDKNVTVVPETRSLTEAGYGKQPWSYNGTTAIIRVINAFWVTLETGKKRKSIPIDKIILNWDDDHSWLKLIVEN